MRLQMCVCFASQETGNKIKLCRGNKKGPSKSGEQGRARCSSLDLREKGNTNCAPLAHETSLSNLTSDNAINKRLKISPSSILLSFCFPQWVARVARRTNERQFDETGGPNLEEQEWPLAPTSSGNTRAKPDELGGRDATDCLWEFAHLGYFAPFAEIAPKRQREYPVQSNVRPHTVITAHREPVPKSPFRPVRTRNCPRTQKNPQNSRATRKSPQTVGRSPVQSRNNTSELD